jgi:Na+/H+ antiporter NhaD/arsenite permease-like protein
VLTELPPFMGMMLGLGGMWVVTDLLHYRYREQHHLLVTSILPKVDISIILFYLGVLLSINALESAGILKNISLWLNEYTPHYLLIPFTIGLASSVIDNVSLVAATIGMYDLTKFSVDSTFWQAIAYAAGTGGSLLIVGSAAGVALMSMEKVDFMWYARKMTFPALLTYLAGLISYILIRYFTQSAFAH